MEKTNKIIIVALIIVIIALLVGIFAMMSGPAKEASKIAIKCNSTINEGDSIRIVLLDLNNTPISNQTVNVSIMDKNKAKDYHSVVTNQKGVATLKINKSEGDYIINCTYAGNDNYTGNTTAKKIKVEKEEVAAQTQSSSSASSDTYVERREGNLEYGYKDGRYGFWTPSGNFIEDKSRALSGQDPVEPFMRDGDFYSQG